MTVTRNPTSSGAPADVGFDTTHRFETSWILPPGGLFAVRALLALYAFVTTFTRLGFQGSAISLQFSYFTVLTYWGLSFYMLFSALHTASYWRTGIPFLARWPHFLQTMHSMFYTTIVVYPFLVTIVFWSILYSRFYSAAQAWDNTSVHALNSVYALFEIIVPRTAPLPWVHVIVVVIVLALYLSLAYLTYGTQHTFVYDFLDYRAHSSGLVAGYIIGILVGTIIIFAIIRYLIMCRMWITEQKLGQRGKFTHRGVGHVRGTDEEVGNNFALQEIHSK